MLSTRLKRVSIMLSLVSLAGCTTLGPDFNGIKPKALPTSWSQEDVANTTQNLDLWWKQFNDPILDTLIDKASAQNLDLEAAGLRILQARMALGITDALRYPQVQTASGTLGAIYQNEHGFKHSDLSFDAGWEMDIWGKYARGIESAEATLYATIASYHEVGISITAEVARNYLNYRTYQERMLLSKRNIKVQERVVNITQAQYDSGNVTELDVQQAKSQLYSTKATLPSYKLGMVQTQNALAVLLGVMPEDIPEMLDNPEIEQRINSFDSGYDHADAKRVASTYDSNSLVPLAPTINPEINANLVLRRPDLQIAELQAHAQSAQIGLAKTALYPSFSLAGTIGINSTVQTDHSFSFSDSLLLAAGPTFSWNIFQYGRLRNKVRLEDAAFQETLTNYNKALLSAVSEVSTALDAYQLYQEQKALRFNAVSASVRAYNISLIQYENGQITFERLLNSVERMTRSEDTYAQVKGNLATQVVSLYKSLGGGWEANTGKSFISDENIKQMKNRTNWGDHLDEPMVLPPLKAPNNNESTKAEDVKQEENENAS